MGRALLVLETPEDRQKAVSWINKAPVGTRVEFKASKRSLPQNDRLWAMLTDIREHMKAKGVDYTTDQFKVIFLHAWGKEVEFLPALDGKTFVPYGQSSSDLSKEEMTSFIEFIIAWGAENGITFHDPNTEASDAGGAQASGDDGTATSPGDAVDEPAGDTPTSAPAGSEPSLFGKFDFAERELIDLKDLARKALDDAAGDNDAPAKEAAVSKLFDGYDDVIESTEGRKAMEALKAPIAAVINRKRSREQAAAYIAKELLDCPASDLEGRR